MGVFFENKNYVTLENENPLQGYKLPQLFLFRNLLKHPLI